MRIRALGLQYDQLCLISWDNMIGTQKFNDEIGARYHGKYYNHIADNQLLHLTLIIHIKVQMSNLIFRDRWFIKRHNSCIRLQQIYLRSQKCIINTMCTLQSPRMPFSMTHSIDIEKRNKGEIRIYIRVYISDNMHEMSITCHTLSTYNIYWALGTYRNRWIFPFFWISPICTPTIVLTRTWYLPHAIWIGTTYMSN